MSTYFSLIPSGVLQNPEISDGAKLTYALILGLANRNGYCFASNAYLASNRGMSESGVRKHVSELKIHGCIELEYNQRNDRRIIPIITPSSQEKSLKASKNKQYGSYNIDEIDKMLDDVWKKMK
jgi:biotin operon repressor